MEPSDAEKAWRSQELPAPNEAYISMIAGLLREEDRSFRHMLWWRDFREIGVAIALALFFAYTGRSWIRWLSVGSLLFVAAYILRARLPASKEPSHLAEKLQQMIREVNRQISLLRSVLWWYLLPCAVAVAAIAAERLALPLNWPRISIMGGVGLLLYGAIYWVNQFTVRKTLKPRREQLERLLDELMNTG